jgi:alcohol dehydrogenase YqhD (iron-dependent ADH family)
VGAGTYPQNGSAYWKKLEIPMRFKDYVINGTSADFMRSEGRAEEANIFEGLAEQSIQQQIDVYIRQQGQNMRMNMVYTY